MSRVDKYLPFAFEAITNINLGTVAKPKKLTDGANISKVYKGYISSLGANIIQAGLKTAIYFYEAKESGSSGNKQLITASIHYILEKNNGVANPDIEKLSTRFESANADLELLAKQIMDAATALKLAIRTYNMI
jgi:CRISPR-associated protein Cmr5